MQHKVLDPYVYKARVKRVVDGDTVVLDVDVGFGDWKLASRFPGGPDAPYPQGRYRLNGIDTPEKHGATKAAGLESKSRVEQLVSLSESGDEVFVRTTKHGKFRFLVDLFVKTGRDDDFYKAFDFDAESKSWLSKEDLADLMKQTDETESGSSVIRALVSEILFLRRERADEGIIHVNQQLIEEGLAKPYFGGKK